ncbi:MAG TPA: FtsX-like permease family protein [Bryobacteraceae bacterium]|jgi:predicted permease|nr:FtsX-like permease family protein [Bryobacteraceae bacterium]
MRILRKLWQRVYYLLNRRRLECELAEEMEAHRAMMPADRRLHFGNATRLREESCDVWSWMWLAQFWQDLHHGARVLWCAPGFTLGAVAILALGIGVNLAEFQIFDAFIFHRVSIQDADSVLQFSRVSRQASSSGFSSAAIEFYSAENRSFAWLVSEDTSFTVIVDGETGVRSNFVSGNYFRSIGIVPAWGRLLDAHDAQPNAPAVAVLGYDYWQSHWISDPHVIGHVIHVNNKLVEIIGVLPYSFGGLSPHRTALWFPAAIRQLLVTGSSPIQQDFSRTTNLLFGKLKPGISRAAGDAELTSLTRELIHRQPHSFYDKERIQGQHLQEAVIHAAERAPAIAIFILMVLLILLSACANLGNMLLTRGLVRQREIGIRMAVGAGRARMLRQLMTENFLLGILGTVAGLAFGAVSARLLLNALDAPSNIHLSISWPILVAGVVLIFVSTLAFGLPSALQTVHANGRKLPLRQSLVGVQVAVSCFLLIASGVMAHNGILSASVDLAFDYQNMIIVDPQYYEQKLPASVVRQKLNVLTTRLSALPGVDGVTAAVVPPLGGRLRMENPPALPHVYLNPVAASYFSVMNLPIVRGRTFFEGEQNAIIVSESAARAVWPNQNPVGKVWDLAGAERTVTGVAKDSGANLLADTGSIEAYVPIQAADEESSELILHSRADPALLARKVTAAANEAVSISLMRASWENFLAGQRNIVTLIGSIGLVATILAAAGMFALVAFAVAHRKREFGIRIALGARDRHILGMLMMQNAKPTMIGVVAGVILATILSLLVRDSIFIPRGETLDFAGFAIGLACFTFVAGLATLSPALRALRIDPSKTLREE